MYPYLTLMMFKRLYFQGSSFRSPQVTYIGKMCSHWIFLEVYIGTWFHFFSSELHFMEVYVITKEKKYNSFRGKGITVWQL